MRRKEKSHREKLFLIEGFGVVYHEFRGDCTKGPGVGLGQSIPEIPNTNHCILDFPYHHWDDRDVSSILTSCCGGLSTEFS